MAVARPEQLEKLEKDVVKTREGARQGCDLGANYAVLGPYDYLDICEAPNTRSGFGGLSLLR